MAYIYSRMKIGAEKPFHIIHMADTHFTLADDRDDDEKLQLARGRRRVFPHSEEQLNAAASKSRELSCPIMHTGDFIDFVSAANLDMMRSFIRENDVFYAAGNHDFSLYCGEEFEDAAYRNRSLARVQDCHRNNIRMDSRVINGVNFVALDDGYFMLEDEQTEFLRTQAKRGLPIVLMLHKPIYDEEMLEFSMKTHHSGAIVCMPDEMMEGRDDEWVREHKADGATRRAVEYIKNEPLIRGMLAGHMHMNYEGHFNGKIPLFLTSDEDVRIIEIE